MVSPLTNVGAFGSADSNGIRPPFAALNCASELIVLVVVALNVLARL